MDFDIVKVHNDWGNFYILDTDPTRLVIKEDGISICLQVCINHSPPRQRLKSIKFYRNISSFQTTEADLVSKYLWFSHWMKHSLNWWQVTLGSAWLRLACVFSNGFIHWHLLAFGGFLMLGVQALIRVNPSVLVKWWSYTCKRNQYDQLTVNKKNKITYE